MSPSRLEYLFNCYLDKSCTEAEKRELMLLISQPENQLLLKQLLDKASSGGVPQIHLPDENAAAILRKILDHNSDTEISQDAKPRINYSPTWLRIAASLLIIIGTGYWFFYKPASKEVILATTHLPTPRKTGGALLTLSNGKKIELDQTQTATYQLGSVTVNKSGTLLDFNKDDSKALNQPVVYNTLSTPAGSQYQVVLPDGTKVWLNAGSSIRFPSKFEGADRQVSLTGEGYFEVTKDKHHPFQVISGDMTVNVLGTHFNVNAFGDNGSVKTSLLEGSVKITRASSSILLKPGQQAVLDNIHGGIETNYANMQQVLAWKNGLFQFEGADIHAIMGEIGRWYDVQIVYEGRIPVRSFEGKISRDSELSEVLKILELSDVKFTVNGKKITVGH